MDLIYSAPELEALSNKTLGTLNMGWQPIAASAAAQGYDKGGNSLGLEETPQVWMALNTGWGDSADDEAVHAIPKAIMDRVEQLTGKSAAHIEYEFMNDASWDQEVLKNYGPENVARFQAVSKKYDPSGMFQNLVPGGWKIPA